MGEITNPFLLSEFLGDMEKADKLPKTILYNLNPVDSAMMSTMAVNFAVNGAKVQYGAAWWLLDHIRGSSDQLMETGLLSGSVGMLTDSRAFTSFVRHEYFRRILCNKIGTLVEDGQYPCDMETLGEMVQNICCKNAIEFSVFKFFVFYINLNSLIKTKGNCKGCLLFWNNFDKLNCSINPNL